MEAQRVTIEQSMLQFHLNGINPGDADSLLEAMHRHVVDLLDMGHYPSRQMLAMISCALRAAWWPDRKQAKRSEEAGWLITVQGAIDHLAATTYRDSSAPRTRAEEAVAERLGLNVDSLRRKRTRFRARLEKRAAVVERQREAAVERRCSRSLKKR
jgi:hypothetical protein